MPRPQWDKRAVENLFRRMDPGKRDEFLSQLSDDQLQNLQAVLTGRRKVLFDDRPTVQPQGKVNRRQGEGRPRDIASIGVKMLAMGGELLHDAEVHYQRKAPSVPWDVSQALYALARALRNRD